MMELIIQLQSILVYTRLFFYPVGGIACVGCVVVVVAICLRAASIFTLLSLPS